MASLPSDTLSITVSPEVCWPEGGDYSAQIIEEIASVFHESVSESFGAQIWVTEIEFCDVGSSERAFRIAAREAARSLISVGAFTDMRPTLTPKPNGEQAAP